VISFQVIVVWDFGRAAIDLRRYSFNYTQHLSSLQKQNWQATKRLNGNIQLVTLDEAMDEKRKGSLFIA